MKLRPHHLLCTQSYVGKGYRDDFIENMNAITARLRNEPGVMVEIVTSTDDICAKCPLMLGEDLCKTNDKVKRMDSKVMEHFGVGEGDYVYQDIAREIAAKITPDIMGDICGGCRWLDIAPCREILLGGK